MSETLPRRTRIDVPRQTSVPFRKREIARPELLNQSWLTNIKKATTTSRITVIRIHERCSAEGWSGGAAASGAACFFRKGEE